MRTEEILEPTVKERESTALGMACKLTRSSSKKPRNIEADTHLCKSRSLKFLSKTAKAGNFSNYKKSSKAHIRKSNVDLFICYFFVVHGKILYLHKTTKNK